MTTEPTEFRFLDPGPLVDGDFELVLVSAQSCDTGHGVVPQYNFEMRLTGTATKIGLIKLRPFLTDKLRQFGGNLSYDVDEGYRGQRYAARGCRLLFTLARRHGLESLLITCDPENMASRKTCERIGARCVDTIEAEIESGKYRQTSRFIVRLEQTR